jgi:hypothetical protein
MHILTYLHDPDIFPPFRQKKRISDPKVTSLILTSLHPLHIAKESKAKNKWKNKPDRQNYIPSSSTRRGVLMDECG